MGNFCSFDDQYASKKSFIMRKRTLNHNQRKKRVYEEQIESALNVALQKFHERYSITRLNIKSLVGKGGQGHVFQVQMETSENSDVQGQFAMKRVPKNILDTQRTKQAILLEKDILSQHVCPFISNIQFACQDKSYLYYIMKIAKGGDAYSLLSSYDSKPYQFASLGQQGVKFLLAGCVLGMEYLHQRKIIYRDLKPENILIYEDGYPKLADFGIAKRIQQDQDLCYEIKGTVVYFAPQIVERKGYDKSIDLWSLGILAYELFFRNAPFSSSLVKSSRFIEKCLERENPQTLFSQNFFKDRQNNRNRIPKNAKCLINSLLRTQPNQRLGYNSFDQIRNHSFFENFDWKSYQNKSLQSPLKSIIEKYPIEMKSLNQLQEQLQQKLQGDFKRLSFTFVKSERKFQSQKINNIILLQKDEQQKSIADSSQQSEIDIYQQLQQEKQAIDKNLKQISNINLICQSFVINTGV